MDESLTSLIPYTGDEIAWARCRPKAHRTPIPNVGDQVCYRHDYWGPVTPADVLQVQSPDDVDDPHMWTVQRDPVTGLPMLFDGKPLLVQQSDPWPLLILRTRHGVGESREARLRGAPGWLPADWAVRYRPLPAFATLTPAH